jgi:amino acid transporter
MASVILVFQLGQPRIWMSMSRDGLLPKAFSKIHPRYKTPSFATIITGIVVAVPALFMNLTEVTDLTSIGTLFAFIVVCAGVLVLQQKRNVKETSKYSVPYINGKYLMPVLTAILLWLNIRYNKAYWNDFFHIDGENWVQIAEKIPMVIFLITCFAMSWISFRKKLSLIPVLGLLSCMFLMTKLGYTNWLRFLIWLGVGLVIYFAFSRNKSRLNSLKLTIFRSGDNEIS